MANPFGRSGRRRRLLQEEVRCGSSVHRALAGPAEDAPEDVPRYSEAAGVEHHPQVTDFVPRRYRSIALLATVGIGATATLAALHWFVSGAATSLYGPRAARGLTLGVAGSLAGWMSAMVLMVSAGVCWLIYSLRRHRIDDYRGRYRVWFAAAIACAVLSANCVAAGHRLFATLAAHHSGWTALPADAVWWLAAGLPLVWIACRAGFDARESRLATVALATALGAYAAGLLAAVGPVTIESPQLTAMIPASAALLGHWMLLVGLVSYSRYVVLDAQGLIPARSRPGGKKWQRAGQEHGEMGSFPAQSQPLDDDQQPTAPAGIAAAARPTSKALRQEVDRTRWTDGSEPELNDYDDQGPTKSRKLSKAQRKRLRKLKAQTRAA